MLRFNLSQGLAQLAALCIPNATTSRVALWRLRNRTEQGVSLSSVAMHCVQDCIGMVSLGVLNNDIKKANVLVTALSSTNPSHFPILGTITDYGLATYLKPGEDSTSAPGATLNTTAPESLPTAEQEGRSSFASDRYSLGILLLDTLLYCEEPLARYSPELPAMIRSLLDPDPDRRPPLAKLMMALMLWRGKMKLALSENGELGSTSLPEYAPLAVARNPKLILGSLRRFMTARDSICRSIFRSYDEAACLVGLPYMHLWLAFSAVGHVDQLAPHIEGVCLYKSGRSDDGLRFQAMRAKVAAVSQVMEGVNVLLGLEGKKTLGAGSAERSARDRADAQAVFEKAMRGVLRASQRV